MESDHKSNECNSEEQAGLTESVTSGAVWEEAEVSETLRLRSALAASTKSVSGRNPLVQFTCIFDRGP